MRCLDSWWQLKTHYCVFSMRRWLCNIDAACLRCDAELWQMRCDIVSLLLHGHHPPLSLVSSVRPGQMQHIDHGDDTWWQSQQLRIVLPSILLQSGMPARYQSKHQNNPNRKLCNSNFLRTGGFMWQRISILFHVLHELRSHGDMVSGLMTLLTLIQRQHTILALSS